ncbi:mll1420 [Mesorhizobium japonicum MAFF 303099]|uniref:Mll1420 protein n=1 Tax=Mesorhizobium japonicum (strain LMG 29417 / CECT 9101 / MAFF 303099) TaxID=266835 RepID=Q98KL5_RHILO|nr:mll1420 [Mesorhizobium japonicum MAFF 303099]
MPDPKPFPGLGFILGVEMAEFDGRRRGQGVSRVRCPVRHADRRAAAYMLECMGGAQLEGLVGNVGPVDTVVIDDAHGHVDSLMERIGRLQQTEHVFRIGRRDMTDNVDGEQVVAIGVDATDRRHGLQEIHGLCLLWRNALVFWNTGNPYLFPSKAL